ncbi:IclR family transcriptional regulator [Nocardia brasiliensis]
MVRIGGVLSANGVRTPDPAGSMLEKVLLLIEQLVSREGELPLGVSELARCTGLAKSSTHRLLQRMCALGLAEAATVGYRPGARLSAWAAGAGAGYGGELIRRAAIPHMERLLQRFPHAVVACILLDGRHTWFLDMIYSRNAAPLAVSCNVDTPLHATAVGKLYLALGEMDPGTLIDKDPLPSDTPHTRATLAELTGELAEIRRAGIAYEYEEYCLGWTSVATPIRLHRPHMFAALVISAAEPDITTAERSLRRAAKAVVDTAGLTAPPGSFGSNGGRTYFISSLSRRS